MNVFLSCEIKFIYKNLWEVTDFFLRFRSAMDVSGESMVKRWQRVILVHVPTIVAPWLLDAQFVSR